MTREEQLLLEAIKNNLFHNSERSLGITPGGVKETSNFFEHQWNSIEASFALKAAGSPFMESLTSAFHDIHSYKYLDDPTFGVALDKRLSAIGIPTEERKNAIRYVEDIRKEYGKDFQEKASGWNPHLDEIADMTRNANQRKSEVTKPYSGGGDSPAKDEIK